VVAVVRFDDFSGGHAGDVDRSRAKKGQWFGRDVMLYLDGLVGPRPPLRPLALDPVPSLSVAPTDAALWEATGAVAIAGQTFYRIAPPISDFSFPRTVASVALGSTGFGIAVDTPPAGTLPRALITRDSGTSGIRLVEVATMSTTDITTPTSTSEVVVRWNERFVYAKGNTIYYSGTPDSPTDLTQWPATNNYIVGDGGEITALIPSPLALYVAKRSGWWVITGVLGSTATIRQVVERQGVEPANIFVASSAGARTVQAWDRGMLWLRRRYDPAAADAQGVEAPYAQLSELRTFTGAVMGDVANVYATNAARLVGLPVGAALVDQVGRGPDTAVRVSLLDNQGRLSSHDFPTIDATAVPCPLLTAEGSNGANGYDPDHLVVVYRTSAGQMALAAWRYRTSRPGYGSDSDKTVGDGGAHANVIGTFSPPDHWSTDGRELSVSSVKVAARVYDTSGAGTTATISTARVRCRVQMLGVELPNLGATVLSTQQTWSRVIPLSTGDHDVYLRFDVSDAGRGPGFRINLELENVAVRAVTVMVEEAAPVR
jgi:hypothetical protein